MWYNDGAGGISNTYVAYISQHVGGVAYNGEGKRYTQYSLVAWWRGCTRRIGVAVSLGVTGVRWRRQRGG